MWYPAPVPLVLSLSFSVLFTCNRKQRGGGTIVPHTLIPLCLFSWENPAGVCGTIWGVQFVDETLDDKKSTAKFADFSFKSVKCVKCGVNLSCGLRQRRHAPPRIQECLAQVAYELRFCPTHPSPTHPSNNQSSRSPALLIWVKVGLPVAHLSTCRKYMQRVSFSKAYRVSDFSSHFSRSLPSYFSPLVPLPPS